MKKEDYYLFLASSTKETEAIVRNLLRTGKRIRMCVEDIKVDKKRYFDILEKFESFTECDLRSDHYIQQLEYIFKKKGLNKINNIIYAQDLNYKYEEYVIEKKPEFKSFEKSNPYLQNFLDILQKFNKYSIDKTILKTDSIKFRRALRLLDYIKKNEDIKEITYITYIDKFNDKRGGSIFPNFVYLYNTLIELMLHRSKINHNIVRTSSNTNTIILPQVLTGIINKRTNLNTTGDFHIIEAQKAPDDIAIDDVSALNVVIKDKQQSNTNNRLFLKDYTEVNTELVRSKIGMLFILSGFSYKMLAFIISKRYKI